MSFLNANQMGQVRKAYPTHPRIDLLLRSSIPGLVIVFALFASCLVVYAQAVANPPKSKSADPPSSKAEIASSRPVIEFFDQDSRTWLHVGEMVRISMQGTPGGQASFQIAGVATTFPMQETSPGHYIGRWARPASGTLPLGIAIINGTLTVQGKSSPVAQATRPLYLDSVPPVLSNPLPMTAVTTSTPTLSAEFRDEGSGVDVDSVRFIIDGRDYTGEANISADHLQFHPVIPFPAGNHMVEINLTDKAGNMARLAWNFRIAQ